MINTHKDHPVLNVSLHVAECLQKLKAFSVLSEKDCKNCVETGNLLGLIEELKLLKTEIASELKVNSHNNEIAEFLKDLTRYQTLFETVKVKITERAKAEKTMSISDAEKNLYYLCMNFSEKYLCNIKNIYYHNNPYLQGLVVLEWSKDDYVEGIIKDTVNYHYEKAKDYKDEIIYEKEEFRKIVEQYDDQNLQSKRKYQDLGMIHFGQLYQFTQCSGMLKDEAQIKFEALLYMIELAPSQRVIERRMTMRY